MHGLTPSLVWFERAEISTHLNIGPHTAPASFRFAHNLWQAYDRPAESQPKLPVREENAVVGRDPQFKDPVAGNYAIRAESPAVGAGRAVAGVKADLAGRCYGEPPSIGAYEVGGK